MHNSQNITVILVPKLQALNVGSALVVAQDGRKKIRE